MLSENLSVSNAASIHSPSTIHNLDDDASQNGHPAMILDFPYRTQSLASMRKLGCIIIGQARLPDGDFRR